ncbi:conserved hypothetical protein [uncultured Sporomusa sp.]|uniref:SF3 helicase domain-containing protein n=1 Tax=uncultured Sporomusa sp. TaxID=307249 RepID=A0A212LY36_9FIRM|nr:phage/plasmid primase, P4 family [uncultured Sporomusa sp.]SCM82442.1 conserved hypothetical protein [uncultured Sporomusa sp.]
MFQKIPKELQSISQWAIYQKSNKIPCNPYTGKYADCNNPKTYSDFETAITALQKFKYDGLSFCFTKDDSFVGIDLDHCRDAETGELTEQAQYIVQKLNSYTEISVSGTGLHIFCKGLLPKGGRRKGCLEMYSEGKFFAMTGIKLDGLPDTVNERTIEIADVHKEYIGTPETIPPPAQRIEAAQNDLSDSEILEKALQNPKFARLWAGQHDGDHSAGDLALCNYLAFWCGCDAARMDSLFRQSALMRSKWDKRHGRNTYGVMTIQKAIRNCRDIYMPPNKKRQQRQKTEQKAGDIIQQTKNERKFFKYTDLGNAERLIYQNAGNVRYCAELKTFFVWTGKYWRRDTDGEVLRLAIQTVRSMYADAEYAADAKALCDWAKQSESAARLESMTKIAKSLPGVPVAISELDQQKYLLNCQNGTIDLKTGKLNSHRKGDLITHLLPFNYKNYNAETDCKQWVKFLCEITNGDIELMNYLWRLAGLCLSGDTSEHVLNIFYGSKGRNGKGTFLGVVEKIMGDLAIVLPFSTFETKQGQSIPNDIARMSGKRLVVAQESNEGKRLDEALVKTLTGGDRLTGRFLGCEFFDFWPTHKIIMSTNHKPIIRETSNAIWARLRLVPFEVSFEGREDRKLDQKLNAELSEILSWAVAGFAEWQRVGLSCPQKITDACKEYRSDEDIVQTFIDDCCYVNDNCKVSAKELYEVFTGWCSTNGERAIGKKVFNSRIRDRGYEEITGAARMMFFKGIGLADLKNRAIS